MRKSLLELPAVVGSILFLVVPVLAEAQGPIPIGDQFQVNTYTTGGQYSPSVAVAPDASFLVVWQSEESGGTDSDGTSIQAQKFDASGSSIGSQLQVNTYTTGDQSWPRSTVDENGNFVIVWISDGSPGTDTDSLSVQGQVIGATGDRLSDQFQVNAQTTGAQAAWDVAVQPRGRFIVVWSGPGDDDPDRDVQGRRFQFDGTPIGGDFQVNSYTTDEQRYPQLAVDAAGDFVVTWTSDGSYGTDTWSESIQARRFLSDATPSGSDFQVNTYTGDLQAVSYIGASAMGEFVVTWTSFYAPNTSAWTIQAQRFDNNGDPLGQQFQVGSTPTHDQLISPVAIRPSGEFVVVWHAYGFSGIVARGREFKGTGEPLADDFQLNSYSGRAPHVPTVAIGPDGHFVTAWWSFGSTGTDDDRSSIQARMFQSSWIFGDGFEPGDASAWSGTQ